MKLHLLGSVSTYLFVLGTTLSSVSAGQLLEDSLPEIPGDTGTVPAVVWVVVIALIGLVGIARRNST